MQISCSITPKHQKDTLVGFSLFMHIYTKKYVFDETTTIMKVLKMLFDGDDQAWKE